MILKQATAENRVFSFLGISITVLSVQISKDGGAFGNPAGSLTNITGNFYKLALTAGDTDTLGAVAYKFSDTVLGVISANDPSVDQVLPALPGADVSTIAVMTAINGGKMTFTNNGNGTGTVVFRDIADTKNVVSANVTLDSSGRIVARTSVTLNP